MAIDWFTFSAQIVNFLVLVALLRWLLYDRVVSAMNKREAGIANRSEEADRRWKDAEEQVRRYEAKVREVDEQRDGLLAEARRDAREQRQRLLEDARKEVERQREEWNEAWHRERADLLSELRRQAGEAGVEAARRALSQVADADLEERICVAFARRVRELDEEQRREVELHLGDGAVSILSAFDISDEQQERLHGLLRERFGYDGEVSFERSPDLICGLQLDVGGYSFGWNLEKFLHEIHSAFSERLNDQPHADLIQQGMPQGDTDCDEPGNRKHRER